MASPVSSRMLGGRAGRQAARRAEQYCNAPKLAAAIEAAAPGILDAPRRHKYGVSPAAERRHPVTNELFASKAELHRWLELELLQRAGEISELQRQVPFPLEIPAHQDPCSGNWILPHYVGCYIADATYRRRDGTVVVEDVKGLPTPEYRLKKKLMQALHGIAISEVSRRDRR